MVHLVVTDDGDTDGHDFREIPVKYIIFGLKRGSVSKAAETEISPESSVSQFLAQVQVHTLFMNEW
jgi:hypothetical protein